MELPPKPSELARFNPWPHLYRRSGKTNNRRLSMDNELKEIANKLEGYNEKGWLITSAMRGQDGSWSLHIVPRKQSEEPKQEAADDNDK
jgi:hypothetical protein